MSTPDARLRSAPTQLHAAVHIAFLVALLAGVVACWEPLRSAADTIALHRYLEYRAFHLVALILEQPIHQLLLVVALVFALGFGVLFGLRRWLPNWRALALTAKVLGVAFLLLVSAVEIDLRTGPRARPNVILIVIDTLRAANLGIHGYHRDTSPFLDEFGERNIHFSRAYSAAPWTSPAVASLFASYYPTVHGVTTFIRDHRRDKTTAKGLVFDDGFLTLAEVLRDRGYTTVGITANPILRPKLGFAQGFEVFRSFEKHPRADFINEQAYEVLENRTDTRPLFLYVHYFDPHNPYSPPKAHDLFRDPSDSRDPKDVADKLDRYDGEIHYVDSKIGELIQWLEDADLYEDSIVIITSDHGEQFKEHGKVHHGNNVFNPEIHVPLMMKLPEKTSGRVDTSVSIVDIYPTLLDLLEIDVAHPLQGVSLIDGLDERTDGVIAEMPHELNVKALMRPDGKKLIARFDTPVPQFVERDSERELLVFDPRKDYWERAPESDGQLLEELRDAFYTVYDRSRVLRGEIGPSEVKQESLEDTMVEQLQALGYIE